MRWLLVLALLPWWLTAAPLADTIESIAKSSGVAQRAFWGLHVVDLETGKTVYSRNAAKLFVPASNAKLFSTSLALLRLGQNHRFRTVIAADGTPSEDGTLNSSLRLVGIGDPTLSGRSYPYEDAPIRGNPLGPLEALADAVVAEGIRHIEGDIVGDDSAYVREPYPDGWAQEDASWEYGAPVSALTLHDNAFRLSIRPGTVGAPAVLGFNPPVEYYTVRNHVKTTATGESRVFLDWPQGERGLHIWGQVSRQSGARAKLLAIRNPAHYAAWVFARALRERGVTYTGEITTRHQWMYEVADFQRGAAPWVPAGVILAERYSPNLFQILQWINKESQNLHAELVLREVGRVKRNIGSRAAGLSELRALLAEAGVSKYAYEFEDASGLSRLNLVSPEATVKLLRHVFLSTERDGWLETLAVGGEDGTLSHRFRGTSTAGRVVGKTGTLTHSSALSGYLFPEDGRVLAFSIMINNYRSHSSYARRFLDRVVTELLR